MLSLFDQQQSNKKKQSNENTGEFLRMMFFVSLISYISKVVVLDVR